MIDTTDFELSQYRRLIHEAADLQNRIDRLYDKELDVQHSKVSGSTKCFPYIEFHMDVMIEDPKQVAERNEMAAAYNDRLKKARNEALRIEMFIRDIPDSELRQIFQYRYIDGMKMREVGKRMNMDRSNVGKKIHYYLNFPPIPQNAVI